MMRRKMMVTCTVCSWAGGQTEVKEAKHTRELICPNCGCKVEATEDA